MRTGRPFGIVKNHLEFPVIDLRQLDKIPSLALHQFRVCGLDLEGKLEVFRFRMCPASSVDLHAVRVISRLAAVRERVPLENESAAASDDGLDFDLTLLDAVIPLRGGLRDIRIGTGPS